MALADSQPATGRARRSALKTPARAPSKAPGLAEVGQYEGPAGTRFTAPEGCGVSAAGASMRAKMKVCIMCTPGASESVVLTADWAGLGRFSGE